MIEITLKCYDHEIELEIEDQKINRYNEIEIQVAPCKKCIGEAGEETT